MRRLEHWVREAAQRRPEATALVAGAERWSYGELARASAHLAHALVENGARCGDRVGLLLPKSPRTIAALLGVLEAGCIYVPLDPVSPVARLSRIVASCEPHLILTSAAAGAMVGALYASHPGTAVGWLDAAPAPLPVAFDLTMVEQQPDTPVAAAAAAPAAAHILFTSGSTGVPKGVVIEHANVVAFVEWALRHFGTRATDRISSHPPLHFDLSTFDLFGTFAAGAELHLVPPELGLLPARLAEFIRASQLTQWFSVPSLLNHLAKHDAVLQDDFPSLKRLLWCGEVFPTPALMYWMQRLPHVRFTNLYGPTEATIASSYYDVPEVPHDERQAIPIGGACDGEELLVLDQQMQPVPTGEVGDLYIGGTGLSPGYWRDEEKTATAFLADPRPGRAGERLYRTGDLAKRDADGLFYFLGRADSQIKSRGYRIELGEIEAAFNAIDELRECAVVAVPSDGFEGTAICCAYVLAGGVAATPAELRRRVAAALPSYMLPGRWQALDALPKNANGKIDRRRVQEMFAAAAGG